MARPLFLEAQYHDIHDIGVAVEVNVQDLLGDESAAHHFPLPGSKRPKGCKFLGRKLDPLACPRHFASEKIDLEIGNPDAIGPSLRGATQHGADPREKLRKGEGLNHIVATIWLALRLCGASSRIRTVLRRAPERRPYSIRIADLEIDFFRRKVTRAGKRSELSPEEFPDPLGACFPAGGSDEPHSHLRGTVWDVNLDSDANIVDEILRLRKKVDEPFTVALHIPGRGLRAGRPKRLMRVRVCLLPGLSAAPHGPLCFRSVPSPRSFPQVFYDWVLTTDLKHDTNQFLAAELQSLRTFMRQHPRDLQASREEVEREGASYRLCTLLRDHRWARENDRRRPGCDVFGLGSFARPLDRFSTPTAVRRTPRHTLFLLASKWVDVNHPEVGSVLVPLSRREHRRRLPSEDAHRPAREPCWR